MDNTNDNLIAQRTLDWHRARLGVFTASQIGNLRGRPRSASGGLFTDTALTYIYSKMAERMLDPAMVADDTRFADYLYRNDAETRAMRYGTETEAEAVAAYAIRTGSEVSVGGFEHYSEIPSIAASPDGRIGDDGLIEIKCPSAAAFARYCATVKSGAGLLDEKPVYYWQVQCQLLCTGAKWCDWVAYSADCGSMLHIVRIERDEAIISEMCTKVIAANALIENAIAEARKENA